MSRNRGTSILAARPTPSAMCSALWQQGTGADRQLKVYRQSGDIKDVVTFLIHETMRGVPYAPEIGLPDPALAPVTPAP